MWKIADFGISRERSSTRTEKTTQLARGTKCYRAPELLREESKFSNQVDIWALGCILYELAIGEKAFSNDFAVHEYICSKRNLDVPLPNDIEEYALIPLINLIHEMLRMHPRHRPTSEGLHRLFEILNNMGSKAFTSELEDPLISKICQPLSSNDDLKEILWYGYSTLTLIPGKFPQARKMFHRIS
jgi:serine/threonine protein kinase